MNSTFRILAVTGVLVTCARPGLAGEALARGDETWVGRAEGQLDGWAAEGPIEEAVTAFQEAIDLEPESLEAHWKLLRALWFQGDYTRRDGAAQKAVFDRGRRVGEAAFALLADRAGVDGDLEKLDPPQVAKALAGIPEAPAVYFWSAVHWGLWGKAFGKLAAARQGVAGRVRRYAEAVILLDEEFESAGGHRVLGRLHAEAPKIPFVTGWVDRGQAVAELERAVELAPDYLFNRWYLALTLSEHRSKERERILELLRDVLDRDPAGERLVEETRIRREAARLLEELTPPS